MNIRARKPIKPKLVVMVAYKKKNKGGWRAFCAPYDISCNAKTFKEVQTLIESLVRLYEEGLREYGYPKHLTIKSLSYAQDRKIFKSVLEKVGADISKTLISKFNAYQTTSEKKIRVSTDSPVPAVASYYSPAVSRNY